MDDDVSVGRGMGALAGVASWVGWLTICPAVGLPTLALAAMLNRVLAPGADPDFWLGWTLLLIGLGVAALLFFAVVERTPLRPSIASGLAYGAICWLLAGAVLMPLLGLLDPFPVAPPPAPPDPMHGSFMMLHLGVGAPVAALIAWLMLGAVLGVTADWQPHSAPRSWAVLYGSAAALALLVVLVKAVPSVPSTAPDSASQTLASGPVAALPQGNLFISVIELPQAPGASLGPHAHVPGFAYAIKGVETLTFADAPTIRVASNEAGFMGAQQSHTHLNVEDRLPAAAVALSIVLGVAVVAFLAVRSLRSDRRLLPAALVLLIAAGGLATWNPWSNDWLFVSVRPASSRGGPMPLPTASRTYESADLAQLPAGPYVETLQTLSIAPGAAALSVGSAGPSLILVVDGRAQVQPIGGSPFSIGLRGAALVQAGSLAQVTAVGDHPVRLIEFTVSPAG